MMEGYYARSKQELQKWVDEQREIIRKMGIDVTGDFEKSCRRWTRMYRPSSYPNIIRNSPNTGIGF